MTLRKNLLVALLAAVLCVLSPWAVPVGGIPVTLATLGVYLAAGLLGAKGGTAAVGLYLAVGAVGAPVFSGFAGGAHQLVGLTGGFLWGYLPCALLSGWLSARKGRFALPLGFAAGTAALYLCGAAWYCLQARTDAGAAVLTCVLPFLPADVAKIGAASLLTASLRRHLPLRERYK